MAAAKSVDEKRGWSQFSQDLSADELDAQAHAQEYYERRYARHIWAGLVRTGR